MNTYETLYNTSFQFITENQLNAFKVLEWRKMLDEDAFDICSYDKLILYFSVNIFQTKLGLSSVDSPKFLKCLEKELYNTLSDKENRGKIDVLLSATISGLSTMVASQFNLDPFIVGGFLDLILLSIYKIGVDAWCKYYEEKNKLNS